MQRVAWIALLIASPALADDEACFEIGGQGIAPCATPHGKVAVESNLIDWTRYGHGADREDSTALPKASPASGWAAIPKRALPGRR